MANAVAPPDVAKSRAPLQGAEHPTPFGTLAVLVDPVDHAVVASHFGSLVSLIAGLPAALATRGSERGHTATVDDAIRSWLTGHPEALMRVPVRQAGGPFMHEVWAALRTVPAGATVTYGELAELAGRPRAARAAGHACATNAVAPFVPCHRVVASTGLGNYGYGVDVKERMLRLEGALPSAA